jgi:hypothetical protein
LISISTLVLKIQQKQNRDETPPCVMGIPSGHVLTHALSCQLRYSKAYVQHNGLAYGEEVEQMWAKLRHLWPRTKHMRADTRVDLISAQLHHITGTMIIALPKTLETQQKRAENVLATTARTLAAYAEAGDLPTEMDLQRIYEQRHVLFGSGNDDSTPSVRARVKYVVSWLKKQYYGDAEQQENASAEQRARMAQRKQECSRELNGMLAHEPSVLDLRNVDGQPFAMLLVPAKHALAVELERSLQLIAAQQQLYMSYRNHRGHSTS